jgi:hypothetical protein
MRAYHVIAVGVMLVVGFAIAVSIPSVRAQLKPITIEHSMWDLRTPLR